MKTKHVIPMLLLTLCSLFSCNWVDNDDQHNPDDSPLTATNYIYEGDLRKFYLQTENTRLNDSIAVWEQVPSSDPGYNDAQADIYEANLTISSNMEEYNAIMSPSDAFLIIGPINPIPPQPSPCLCWTVYNSIGNILLQPGTDQIDITILSETDESPLANTSYDTPITTIPNTNGLARYQSFDFPDTFTGQAIITVQTESGSYSIRADFYNLQ